MLNILVQPRRFLKPLNARFGPSRVIITGKPRSYTELIRQLAPETDHHAHKGINSRIEGSYRPTRKREKLLGRFKVSRQAQRFLSVHDQVNTMFKPRRNRLSATSYRHAQSDAFDLWQSYAVKMTS